MSSVKLIQSIINCGINSISGNQKANLGKFGEMNQTEMKVWWNEIKFMKQSE